MEDSIYVCSVRKNGKREKKTGQKIEKAEEGVIEIKIMAQLDSIGDIVKKLQEIHSII